MVFQPRNRSGVPAVTQPGAHQRRSYQQACPVAHALDLVGERWTLLIVRDLVFGPLRFSDLRDGLPGLAPNLLSDRLRFLVDQG
ncbi:MAG: helix-turn-helix transcriptional regulator, partial [Microthrixaceae bacterium]|nr:helix-turn-helix transcriptional regulator [Microthrixaceae bacterium]